MYTIKFDSEFNSDFEQINALLVKLSIIPENENEILFDLSEVTWIEADLSSFIGALIFNLVQDKKAVYLKKEMDSRVQQILKKNGFLTELFGVEKENDSYFSTIPFFMTKSDAMNKIDDYVVCEIFSKIDEHILINSSIEIIKDSIFEAVHNIKEHSKSDYVFICGQYFHKKQKLKITISDIGISIPINVKNVKKFEYSDGNLIDWAVKKGNSTKSTPASGLGLDQINTHIEGLGELHILSNNGYWSKDIQGKIHINHCTAPFCGTMISIKFDLIGLKNKMSNLKLVDELTF